MYKLERSPAMCINCVPKILQFAEQQKRKSKLYSRKRFLHKIDNSTVFLDDDFFALIFVVVGEITDFYK